MDVDESLWMKVTDGKRYLKLYSNANVSYDLYGHQQIVTGW